MTWRRSKGAYSATHTKPHQEAWPRLAYTKRRATKETNSLTNELTHKRSNLKSSIKYMERPTQRVLLHIYMDLSLSLSLSLLPSLSRSLLSQSVPPACLLSSLLSAHTQPELDISRLPPSPSSLPKGKVLALRLDVAEGVVGGREGAVGALDEEGAEIGRKL